MWFNGGHYLTSTCHIANVCEGLILGAEKGRGGEVYFLTDGEPIEFRTFLTAMLNTRKVDPSNRSIPYSLAWLLAIGAEWVGRTFGLKGQPIVTRTTGKLMGEEVTVDDTKARRELGYQGKMTIAQGLAEMKG